MITFDLVVIPQWLVVISQQGNFKAPQSILSDNSVAKIGMINLRLVAVAIGNQMQIRILCVFSLQRNKFDLVHQKISSWLLALLVLRIDLLTILVIYFHTNRLVYKTVY